MSRTDRVHISPERCLCECEKLEMDTKAIVDRIDKLLDDFYMPEAVVPNLISAVRLIRRATAALEVATTAAKISSQNLR